MAGKSKITSAQLEEADRRIRRGATITEVAKSQNLSFSGLRSALTKWRADQAAPPKQKRPRFDLTAADALARQVEAGEIMGDDELRAEMTALIREMKQQAAAAKTEGEHAEARKINDSRSRVMTAYSRITSRDDPDVLRISKAELATKANALREMFIRRAESAAKMHCQSCGVELLQGWAREAK
jgi:hypothetical protein